MTVVTELAQRLPVALVEEQPLIAFVWNLVVYDAGRCSALAPHAIYAQRMRS